VEVLPPEIMLPAVGQGALAVECRAGDTALRQMLMPLHDPRSAACTGAERAMLAVLDGSCHTPIAGFAQIDGEWLTLDGLLLTPDGSAEIRARRSGPMTASEAVGTALGEDLRSRAGPEFGLGQA
jgi:hydroxymethylbilane synthase